MLKILLSFHVSFYPSLHICLFLFTFNHKANWITFFSTTGNNCCLSNIFSLPFTSTTTLRNVLNTLAPTFCVKVLLSKGSNRNWTAEQDVTADSSVSLLFKYQSLTQNKPWAIYIFECLKCLCFGEHSLTRKAAADERTSLSFFLKIKQQAF